VEVPDVNAVGRRAKLGGEAGGHCRPGGAGEVHDGRDLLRVGGLLRLFGGLLFCHEVFFGLGRLDQNRELLEVRGGIVEHEDEGNRLQLRHLHVRKPLDIKTVRTISVSNIKTNKNDFRRKHSNSKNDFSRRDIKTVRMISIGKIKRVRTISIGNIKTGRAISEGNIKRVTLCRSVARSRIMMTSFTFPTVSKYARTFFSVTFFVSCPTNTVRWSFVRS
jgi:hypothetical protein